MATNVPRGRCPCRAASVEARLAWARRRTANGCRDRARLQRRPSSRARAVAGCSPRAERCGQDPAARTQSASASGSATGSHHEVGGDEREAAEPAFLPAAYEGASRVVVHDCRPRGRKRQPPSRTLAAATDGPCGRCPAALAEREWDPAEAGCDRPRRARRLGCDRRRSAAGTADPALRATVGPEALRLCVSSVKKCGRLPRAGSRSPMSYHSARHLPRVDVSARVEPLDEPAQAGRGCYRRRGTTRSAAVCRRGRSRGRCRTAYERGSSGFSSKYVMRPCASTSVEL